MSLLWFFIAILAGLKEEWFILGTSTISLQICLASLLRMELKKEVEFKNEVLKKYRDTVILLLDTVDIHQKKIADLTSLIVENEAFWESMKKDDKNIDKKD